MAYTWTTGEVITAEKLNSSQTNNYDLIIDFEGDTLSLIGNPLEELYTKIINNEPTKALYYITTAGGEHVHIESFAVSGFIAHGGTQDGSYVVTYRFYNPFTSQSPFSEISIVGNSNTGNAISGATTANYTYSFETKTYVLTINDNSGTFV